MIESFQLGFSNLIRKGSVRDRWRKVEGRGGGDQFQWR